MHKKERRSHLLHESIDRVFQADELSPGVVQLVKVFLAEKRKISVGDKQIEFNFGTVQIISQLLESRFPDCEIGAMPPFGNLYGIEVYVAASLAEDLSLLSRDGDFDAYDIERRWQATG